MHQQERRADLGECANRHPRPKAICGVGKGDPAACNRRVNSSAKGAPKPKRTKVAAVVFMRPFRYFCSAEPQILQECPNESDGDPQLHRRHKYRRLRKCKIGWHSLTVEIPF